MGPMLYNYSEQNLCPFWKTFADPVQYLPSSSSSFCIVCKDKPWTAVFDLRNYKLHDSASYVLPDTFLSVELILNPT